MVGDSLLSKLIPDVWAQEPQEQIHVWVDGGTIQVVGSVHTY